jgi:hypothetical protein
MTEPMIASLWQPYGLRDDPFFQAPLQPCRDAMAPRPATLFVGRENELRLLGSQIVSSSNSRAIVRGDPGVGKTSFINCLKDALSAHGVLSHTHPVLVTPRMTPRQFHAEVLKVLLSMRATLDDARVTGSLGKVKRLLKSETPFAREDAFWRHIGRVVTGEDSIAAQISIAGFGGLREHVRIPPEEEVSLFQEVAEAVEYLSEHGRHRILIHVDNIETLLRPDAAAAVALLHDVRDCFLTDQSHWVFVGATEAEDVVFRAVPQVSGIFPDSITLLPLRPNEVAELLVRRYEHLHSPALTLVYPVAPNAGGELYRRYHGNLHAFLSLLSKAVEQYAVAHPGTPLSGDDVVVTMAPIFREQKYSKLISETDLVQLATTLRGKHCDAEFRVSDVQEANAITMAAAYKLVQHLLAIGVLEKSRQLGHIAFYRVTDGDLTVALGLY